MPAIRGEHIEELTGQARHVDLFEAGDHGGAEEGADPFVVEHADRVAHGRREVRREGLGVARVGEPRGCAAGAALGDLFGFSPLDAQWEALGQSRQGQVDVLRLDDDTDMPGIERALRRLGYTAPRGGSGTGGTWVGGADLVARLSADLTPIQQNVVVLPDDKLVLMSDSAGYLTEAARVARGKADSLTSEAGVTALARAADDPVSAVQWTSTFACEDLTMGSADDADQQVGDRLIAKAGEVSPLEGLVMAHQPDRRLLVGMHFETSQQATANLQTRVDLASGPAPGQGGSFADRFAVTAGEADGQDVRLELTPRSSRAVLSDISTGPVLFATC